MLKIFRKRIMRLDKIKVQEEFKKHYPRSVKLLEKRIYYLTHKKFEQPIVINEAGYLTDGYTTYILAKFYDKKYMLVERG